VPVVAVERRHHLIERRRAEPQARPLPAERLVDFRLGHLAHRHRGGHAGHAINQDALARHERIANGPSAALTVGGRQA